MAILIPSKNIYEINNPKVRDNVVNIVSVNNFNVSIKKEYSTSIADKTYLLGFFNDPIEKKYNRHNHISPSGVQTDLSNAYVSISTNYIRQKQIRIKRTLKNSYIEQIYSKLNEEGQPNITHSVVYDYYEYDVYATEANEYGANITQETLVKSSTSSGKIPSPEVKAGDSYYAYAEIIKDNETNLSSLDISFDESTNEFVLFVTVLVGFESLSLYGIIKGTVTNTNIPVPLSGKRILYAPRELKITFYGDIITIDMIENSIDYGVGSKPFSLNSNELLQYSSVVGSIPTTEYLANNIISQYKNGKETAILLCDINDYYNEQGEKVIDITSNEMCFKLHDEVIPYVFGADGKDYPMSKYQDGLPKVFEVVGSNIIYDGAVWQELSLLEKKV